MMHTQSLNTTILYQYTGPETEPATEPPTQLCEEPETEPEVLCDQLQQGKEEDLLGLNP